MAVRKILRWWRAPVWLLAFSTGAKSFVDNPILGSRRLNRAGLHVARAKVAHRLAWARRRRLAKRVPAEWQVQFDRHGFVVVRNFLPNDAFDRLRQQLLEAELAAREQQQGDTITRRVPVGPNLLAEFPDLRALLSNPHWKRLLAYVASSRSEPLYYIQTVFGGMAPGSPDPQAELHSDAFQPALKSWFFLTDLTEDDRPLTYVAGSHLLTPERLAWERARSSSVMESGDRLSQRGSLRISAEDLAALALPPPTRLAVPANTLVVADTFGFHARGDSDRPTVRAEVWGYCRRSPLLAWTGLDVLSLPGIAERRGEMLAVILDWVDSCGLRPQHWRPVGRRLPLEPPAASASVTAAPSASGPPCTALADIRAQMSPRGQTRGNVRGREARRR